MTEISSVIERSRNLTIQDRATSTDVSGSMVMVVPWIANIGNIIAPWWSTTRDRQLRDFWKRSDHLAGAVYTMTAKMTAIPNKVVAKDMSVKTHVEEANVLTDVLQGAVEYGKGWSEFYAKFVEELLTQDNGVFAEVIGLGNPVGPVIGRAVSVAHLDSFRCTRTGSAIYPVVYHDTDGKRYKLHYSRVMFTSQMTSPIADMFGIGFCAVSRAINVAQTLVDILIYKQEKLGSRPLRELLITKGGLDPNDLREAFYIAEGQMDAQGLSRYSKVIIGGSATMPEADVIRVPLADLPDGFDERTAIELGMATIALAFGVDARELFPAMSSGATRADALLQHLKQRGKGPGQILQTTEQLFNYQFVPPHLKFIFDFQDDAQDRQVAEIRQIRANRRVQDTSTNAVNKRVLRETMYQDGDIDESQFERLELEDGRLPDGTAILSLFYKQKSSTWKYLDIGVADPLDIDANQPETMLKTIGQAKRETLKAMANASSQSGKADAVTSYYALVHLENYYKNPDVFVDFANIPEMPVFNNFGNSGNYVDPRIRNTDLTSPAPDEANRGADGNDDNDDSSYEG